MTPLSTLSCHPCPTSAVFHSDERVGEVVGLAFETALDRELRERGLRLTGDATALLHDAVIPAAYLSVFGTEYEQAQRADVQLFDHLSAAVTRLLGEQIDRYLRSLPTSERKGHPLALCLRKFAKKNRAILRKLKKLGTI